MATDPQITPIAIRHVYTFLPEIIVVIKLTIAKIKKTKSRIFPNSIDIPAILYAPRT